MRLSSILSTLVFIVFQVNASGGTQNTTARSFTENDIIQTLNAHITSKTNATGLVTLNLLHDSKTEKFSLIYEKVHLPATQVSESAYFACTNLRDANKTDTTYDVDFWFVNKNGKLVVEPKKSEIHKVNGAKLFDYNPDGTKTAVPVS